LASDEIQIRRFEVKNSPADDHLKKFPGERAMVVKLEADLEVSWVRRMKLFNTDLSFYILRPKPHFSQLFGIEREIVLVYSQYETLEPRTMQALDSFFKELPARGRVEQTLAIVVSEAADAEAWVQDYGLWSSQVRTYAGVSRENFVSSNDAWYLRNVLSKQLFSRDLFDYTLPLDSDLFFFGRQEIIAEHIDAIRKSENRGLFGLRKTGKTSVLFKVQRQCEEAGVIALYYDGKTPDIYRLNADGLLDRISEDLVDRLPPRHALGWKKKATATARFIHVISRIPDGTKFCLIVDEIEHLTIESTLAPHWKTEFLPFWQTIWSTQSQHRRFSFVIAGVNATVSEIDKIGGVQNPLFGIVKAKYLTGFDQGETRSLLNTIGRRMGIGFDESAVRSLHERYGGHPLLTRKTCSQIHTGLKVSSAARPIQVSSADLERDMVDREAEIQFYCRHITSELEEFYPLEYEMLELLSIGNTADFVELSRDSGLVSHLKHYGLVDLADQFAPALKIPVVRAYIAQQWRRKNNVKVTRYLAAPARRSEYVRGRVESILREMRVAHKRFVERGLPQLYKGGGPEEAERFADLTVVSSRDDLAAFLNQTNRSLIEPIDIVGRERRTSNYFFNDIKSTYPRIFESLNRVRSYRNHYLHLELNNLAEENYRKYLAIDADGADPATLVDGWFQIQAACLDGLLVGLQAELAVYD
jgi:hypothetical protein